MKKMDFQKVIEWLSFLLRCPVCGYRYNLDRTKIIDAQEGDFIKEAGFAQASLMVHSDCGKCKSSVVFNVNFMGPDILSQATVTDLTADDTSKFSDSKPITVGDIYDVHKFFEKFDGDLVKALK